MSKKHKLVGGIITGIGVILFGFGFYILPFGTDIYLYFWVDKVFNGNWLYGSIAGNLFAVFMIILGLLMMREKKEEEGGKKK